MAPFATITCSHLPPQAVLAVMADPMGGTYLTHGQYSHDSVRAIVLGNVSASLLLLASVAPGVWTKVWAYGECAGALS